MCIALPARLVAVEGEVGVVDAAGRRVAVNLAFTPEARVGSWLIVHSGVAVRVVADTAQRAPQGPRASPTVPQE